MIIDIPSKEDAAKIREFLNGNGYHRDGLRSRLGRSRPPAPGEEQEMFVAASKIDLPNLLVQLFLLGGSVDDETAAEFLSTEMLAMFFALGMLEKEGNKTRARVVIVPVDDLLFVSDAFRMLGTDDAEEFVLPASTHSANFLRLLTLRDDVNRTLDLGCGCGIHALFAAQHSKFVIATDISKAAIRYTEFNAVLNNITNIDVRLGSLFEPVADESFDLIVTNPPFVIAPGKTFVYRDNEMMLDEFCRTLVGEAVPHINDGGHLQMLCEWVEISGEPWQQRLTAWIRGCDAWILHGAPLHPADYVRRRSSDISGESVPSGEEQKWNDYMVSNGVAAVHPGMLTLRRRNGANWMHVQNFNGDITVASGHNISNGIAACDFLEDCDDESLLDAILVKSATPSFETDTDSNVEAFVELHDGQRSVKSCIDAYGGSSSSDTNALTIELQQITRVLVSKGYLRPVECVSDEQKKSSRRLLF